VKIQIDVNTLLEFLDKCEGGRLYPQLNEEDTIIRANVNPVTVEFILGKRQPKD